MNMSYMMESEINSQTDILGNLVEKYIVNYCIMLDIPVEIKRVVIVGSGSSYNAGLFAKSFFRNIADTEATVEYASEIANSNFDNFSNDSFYIFVSQSGQSEDVINAFEKIKRMGARTLAITNNIDSHIFKYADFRFYLDTKREYAIAATKTFSASVLALWLIAVKTAQNKHLDVSEEIKNIYSIKTNLSNMIKDVDNLDYAIKFLAKQSGFSIVGIGDNFALAKETALKIKETCYINTSAYPMGEFIHGHYAILNKDRVLLTFITDYTTPKEIEIYKKIITTYKKCKAVIISDSYEDYNSHLLVKFKKSETKIINTLFMIILIQTLAFKMAIRLRHNVDKPKGLDKVVK